MLPFELKERLEFMARRNKFVRRKEGDRIAVLGELSALGIGEEDDIAEFFLNYSMTAVRRKSGTVELQDICSPSPAIRKTTDWLLDSVHLSNDFICLNSGEGEGYILYSKSTKRIFDVGLGDIEKLNAGKIAPRWLDFFALLDWYVC